jgi:hypothetical protein
MIYDGVSKSSRTLRPEQELQIVQLSATRCSCIAVSWVSPVSFAAITLCVASQRVFVVVYFVIDSVRKLLDTPSYTEWLICYQYLLRARCRKRPIFGCRPAVLLMLVRFTTSFNVLLEQTDVIWKGKGHLFRPPTRVVFSVHLGML